MVFTNSTGDAGSIGAARGIAADGLRRHNLAVILRQLHMHGAHSRSQLTSLTGLNRSTIGDLIGELASLGLAEEVQPRSVTGPGRPSPVVSTNPAGAVVLALELDVDSIAAATIGLGGHVFGLTRATRPRAHRSPQEVVRDVRDLAMPLLDGLPPGHNLVGVGAGVAGVTRRSDGFVHIAPNLGWKDVPLGDLVRADLDLGASIMVANEADAGAFGEYRRGESAGARNLVYISGDVGIGVGVVVNGDVLRGQAGYAGEAGHMTVNPTGHACRCGSIGCWETEAGVAALLRRLSLDTDSRSADIVSEIVTQAATGNRKTIDALEELGGWVGVGVANLVNIFNPEVVVLGGGYHKLYPFLEAAVLAQLESRALAAPASIVEVAPSRLGQDAPLIGAAEAVLSRIVENPAEAKANAQ